METSRSSRKLLLIVLIISAGILFYVVAFFFIRGGLTRMQSTDNYRNEWENLAIEYLQQQEDIIERYSSEYIFRCKNAYYGYDKGESMYDANGFQLPTDITLTVLVYKGPVTPSLRRDEYTVFLIRNEDGTYRVESYEVKFLTGSLLET